MNERGITLIETIVALVVIGAIAAIAIKALNPKPEAEVIACQAELSVMQTLVEQAAEQVYPREPTWEEVKQIAGNRWDKHYHYLLNNSDANSGHGNDIDICDEENPGASAENRDCLDLRYVIFCDHDHYLAEVKYNMLIDAWRLPPDPIAVPLDVIDGNKGANLIQRGNDHEFLKDIWYWRVKDPNWQKWIGR